MKLANPPHSGLPHLVGHRRAGDIRRRILRRAASAAPTELVDGADRYLRGQEAISYAALDDLPVLADDNLRDVLSRRSSLSCQATHKSKFFVCTTDSTRSMPSHGRKLSPQIVEVIDEIARALDFLIEVDPERGMRATLRAIQPGDHAATELALSLAQRERHGASDLRDVSEGLRGELFVSLQDMFPASEDQTPVGVHTVTPREDVGDWRNAILASLTHAGTQSSLNVLQELGTRRPDIDLTRAILTAQEAIRVSGWLPLELREIHAMLERRDVRAIRSSATLLELVEDELNRIQGTLKGETPQAFALWNFGPDDYSSPKEENSLSDWYCHALRERLTSAGLIINREVEVRNTPGPGIGHRQDIRIEVANSTTGEHYIVVVEVKGIWNRDVRTSLTTQLAMDYLTDAGISHGVYLVVSFDPEHITSANKRRIARRNLRGLGEHLREQSNALAPALSVIPLLHDANPLWP